MKPTPKALKKQEEEAYFKEATAWDIDRTERLKKSEKLAWNIAIAMTGLAACAVLAVSALAPLKQVEPFVVKVDNSNGIVEIVKRLPAIGETTYSEAITKYFLGRYLSAREGFSQKIAETNYDDVLLMSNNEERLRFQNFFDPQKNTKAPWNVYGAYTTTEVKIISISFLKPKVASIRYLLLTKSGTTTTQSHWIATIGFRYVNAPQSEASRLKNPLGFLVSEYRNDPETVQGATSESERVPANTTADSTLENIPPDAAIPAPATPNEAKQ